MKEAAFETPSCADWIGRTAQLDDVVSAAPVKAMSATPDRDDPLPAAGQALPLLWHWLCFLPCERQSEIGADRHPKRGSFLPPVGHRIHYDRSHVTEVEGYPGLIVHGPLIATLLADLLRRERAEARLSTFEFRAMSPLFDTAPFSVCGRLDDAKHASLWARGPQGQLAMQASATLA